MVRYNYKRCTRGQDRPFGYGKWTKKFVAMNFHNMPIGIVKQPRTKFKLQVVESVQQGCKHKQHKILPKHVFKRLDSFQINWLYGCFQCHFMYNNRKWCVWIFTILKGGGTNKYSTLSPCYKKCNFYCHYYYSFNATHPCSNTHHPLHTSKSTDSSKFKH